MEDDSPVYSTTKPAARPSAAASVLSLVHAAELTGRAPKTLADLPRSFVCDRIDGLTSSVRHASDDASRMSSRLLSLQRVVRQRKCAPSEAREVKAIVTAIAIEASDSQRSAFLMCKGDVLLIQLLHTVAPSAADATFHPLINETLQVLADYAISDGELAEAFATHQPLLALLFRLMAHSELVDASLTLLQELLAVGIDIFPLAQVEALPALLESLSPRGLSLVARALAVLLAKAAEDTGGEGGLPPPECVPPDLCASCANNAALLEVPNLLPRIVSLLRLKLPPPGLWGHMLSQLPLPNLHPHLPSRASLAADDEWDGMEEAPPAPHVVVLLSPEQVPQGLRELIAANPAVLFPGLNLPPAMQNHADLGGSHLHLSSLQTALWSTLQADLLYVLWALMGAKTKGEAQRRLLGLGLYDVLQGMFDRLDWRQPPPMPHPLHGHAPGCTCSLHPQSCLQMQLLRTLQVLLCEKDADQPNYHRLMLRAPAAAAAEAARAAARRRLAAAAPPPPLPPSQPPSQPPPRSRSCTRRLRPRGRPSPPTSVLAAASVAARPRRRRRRRRRGRRRRRRAPGRAGRPGRTRGRRRRRRVR